MLLDLTEQEISFLLKCIKRVRRLDVEYFRYGASSPEIDARIDAAYAIEDELENALSPGADQTKSESKSEQSQKSE